MFLSIFFVRCIGCCVDRNGICLFYLILRGLDTVEDDMSIPLEVKRPLLVDFHEKLYVSGWNFDGNGPNEKDRQLLVEFNLVSMLR